MNSTIPSRFPATPNDVATAMARSMGQQMELGCHLAFNERLNEDVLRRAVRLSLDAQPILGCAFVMGAFGARWQRLGPEDLDARLPFAIAESDDPDADAARFQSTHVDDDGPQVAVGLMRAGGGDHVSIRISHVVADGQSLKRYAYLLAELYTRLLDDDGYAPEPDLRPRPGIREVWAALTPDEQRTAGAAPASVMPNWVVPCRGTSGEGRTFRQLRVAPARFNAAKAYGKDRGTTVNEMLLTAFFRSMASVYPPPAGKSMSLPFSAEHHRYLPDAEHLPITNLSTTLWLGVEHIAGESFDGTLERVTGQMVRWRNALWGVKPTMRVAQASAIGYPAMRLAMNAIAKSAGRKPGATSPVFTNIGIVDDAQLAFGSAVPSSARLSGPAASGASYVPTIGTYRDELTISMGFCAEDTDPAAVDGVLAAMGEELAALA